MSSISARDSRRGYEVELDWLVCTVCMCSCMTRTPPSLAADCVGVTLGRSWSAHGWRRSRRSPATPSPPSTGDPLPPPSLLHYTLSLYTQLLSAQAIVCGIVMVLGVTAADCLSMTLFLRQISPVPRVPSIPTHGCLWHPHSFATIQNTFVEW